MLEIKNLLTHVLPYLPFISAAVVSKTQLNLSSLVSRLLESAIIAAVILYANVQVMETKLAQFDKQLITIERDDNDMKRHIDLNKDTLNKILIQLEGLRKDIHYQNDRSKN